MNSSIGLALVVLAAVLGVRSKYSPGIMRLSYLIAASAVSMFATPAQAQVPPAGFFLDGTSQPGFTKGSISGFTATPTGTLPDPSLSASANGYYDQYGEPQTGTGFATMNYYYTITGPGAPGSLVDVTITGNISGSWSGDGSAEARIFYGTTGELEGSVSGPQMPPAPSSFSIPLNASYDVDLGTVYEISLFVDVNAVFFGAETGSVSASASADPIITVPNGYSIEFSPNLNLAETATPLPAALPLFATGLGALGLLGWRRKRKNAAGLVAA